MKRILVLMVLALVSTTAMAQQHYRDIVYLKNGSVVRGIITEQYPNVSIKIETADQSIFVFRMEEIEKLGKELHRQKDGRIDLATEQASRHIRTVDIGYQKGIWDYGMDRWKLNIVNSYAFSPIVSLGIGTGLRYYKESEAALIPLFANARINFLDATHTPFIAFDIGYSFDATYRLEGVGMLLSPTIGARFGTSEGTTFTIGVGYEMQKMDFFYIYDNGGYYDVGTTSENSGAVSISVGIMF
ncbi:hypothetical protein HCG49_16665 [Arenibacter sp. 6A1]|uniref:hypothetical protein n=1 Tax=Arenibacter sp. 6A1 TaxID=2720391 RepID=UPI00144754DE|nr:hypothetical protein [Arenibacter sp. 6A1]NKI28189.1 hypothetical protein [Arenibacter sp. 6A1]